MAKRLAHQLVVDELPSCRLLIAGKWIEGQATADVTDKFRLRAAMKAHLPSRAQLQECVAAADAAFRASKLTPYERGQILDRTAVLIEQRASELADVVLLSRSGMTRLVDRLKEAKLIRRESCPEDGRGAQVVLTDAGVAALRRIWPEYQSGIREFFARHLSVEEAGMLSRVWGKVLEADSP